MGVNMLSKKAFEAAMTAIVQQIREDQRITTHLQAITNTDFHCYYDTKYALKGLIDLVKHIAKDDNDWIDYWLWDLDCGEKYIRGSVKSARGRPIKLKTITDLYNLLKKEYK